MKGAGVLAKKKIFTEMFFSLFAVLICQRLGAVGRWPNPPKKKGDFPRHNKKKHTQLTNARGA